jgi:hypothetical protein
MEVAMWGVHRWRWIAAASVVTAAAGVLVIGGVPASAEAWADRQGAGCAIAVQRHGRPDAAPPAPAPAAPGVAVPPSGVAVPVAQKPRPRDPADYRMGTFRAAGCQAWLQLHRHRAGHDR